MPSTNYAYVNGRFVPENEATVSIFDRGFLYGDGVFETMRVYGGEVFRLTEHTERLMAGVGYLGIRIEETPEVLQATCKELARRNQVREGMVRLHITRGLSNVGLSVKSAGRPTIIVLAQRREFEATPTCLRVITSSQRIDPRSRLSGHKTANRLPYVLAKLEAERAGMDDALLLNVNEECVELTASNLFVVKRGDLFTPRVMDGALPGIVRNTVLKLADQEAIATSEEGFGREFLQDAEEVFATNSLFEITPVISLDGKTFPSQSVTNRLSMVYSETVREELGL